MKKIAVKNFSPPPVNRPDFDTNIYESDLGWCQYDYNEAMALTPEDVLRYYLDMGYDMYIFDTVTMAWYFIDTCWGPGVRLTKLRVRDDWDGKYIEGNSVLDQIGDDSPDLMFRADTVDEFIKGAKITGRPISDVVDHSVIDLS